MTILKFSRNWNNKLACDRFTTIRRKDMLLHETVEVLLEEEKIFTAQIIQKYKIKFSEINDFMASIDVGMSAPKLKEILKRLYSKDNIQEDSIFFLYVLEVKDRIPLVLNSDKV